MSETTITTADGKVLREGDRAFNFYDGWWGTVGTIDEQGWFTLSGDEGRRAALNGERVAVVVPSSNPFYAEWAAGAAWTDRPRSLADAAQPSALTDEDVEDIEAAHAAAFECEECAFEADTAGQAVAHTDTATSGGHLVVKVEGTDRKAVARAAQQRRHDLLTDAIALEEHAEGLRRQAADEYRTWLQATD